MKYDYLKLAEIIKKCREEKGISTRNLGEKVGVSHTEISQIENGMRPHFSFVVLAKLCKELEIDMMNLLDDVGIWNVDDDQLFYVMLKTDEENIFKVHARCEYEAARLVLDFVLENELIEFDKSRKDLLVGIVKNPEDFNRKVLDNYEKTGQLSNEEIDDIEEEYDSECEEDLEEICCETCVHYCPYCEECTLDE